MPSTHTGTSRKTVVRVLRSSVVSQLVSAIVGFAILPRVIKGVNISNYGEWATLAAILAIGQLAQSGVGTEIARRVATAQGARDTAAIQMAVRQGVTVLTGVGLLIELVTIAVAHPVVNLVFSTVTAGQRGQLVLLLIGIVTLFAIGLVGNAFFSVLTGLQRSDYAIWSGIAAVVAGAFATLAGLAAGLGLWALFIADCVQLLVTWVGPMLGVRRLLPDLKFRLIWVSRAAVISFIGMPTMLFVAAASDLFDSQVDKLVLTHTVGPKASAMFQIGVSMVQLVRGVALIPLAVMLAGTAELYRSNPSRLRRLETLSGSSVQAIGATCAGGLMLFAGPLVTLWLGPGYSEVALSARVLAAASLLNIWSAPWSYYAIGRGRYHYVLIGAGTTAIVNAATTVLLTTRIGLAGALIGSVAGSTAGTLIARLLLLRWERREWLSPALRATTVVAVVVVPAMFMRVQIPASWIGLVGWGSAYLVVCGILLFTTGTLPLRVDMSSGSLPRLAWRQAEPMALARDSEPRRGPK